MKSIFVFMSGAFFVVSCSSNNDQISNPEVNDSTTIVSEKKSFQNIEFEAADSLLISANLYEADPAFPLMILCHQRGFNKYEYAGVAERFNELGFNCLAIDQRCGGPIADHPNETWLRAIEKKKATDFLDAEQDIIAAIDYGYEKYKRPVILLGSSYSSTLCVYQAIENEKVSAVIAFSPGNYFYYDGVKPNLIDEMAKYEKPFFFTAAKNEMPYVRELVLGTPRSETQVVFAPEGEGMHGARILWPNQEGGEEYWRALENFLDQIYHLQEVPN